jgi:uncharacterized membrane protein
MVAAPGIAIVGLALIGLHNVTDAAPPDAFGAFAWLWRVLHVPDPNAETWLRIDYPIVPWVGVMAAGYCLGPLLRILVISKTMVFVPFTGAIGANCHIE